MGRSVVVRPAGPADADADAVTAVLEQAYPRLMAAAYEPELLRRALPAMVRANPVLLASGTYYVAEAGGGRALVGCGGWTRERPGTGEIRPGLAHLRHFATDPDHAGRGVGRAICERCEAQARTAGTRALECYASLNAEGFYAALGFAALGRVDLPFGDGLVFPSVLMRRSI